MEVQMKVDNVKELLELMRGIEPDRFKMSYFADGVLSHRTCGTAGCIAGWAMVAKNGSFDPDNDLDAVYDVAGDWLGLSRGRQRGQLFSPPGYASFPKIYSLGRAIATLQRMIDVYSQTGVVAVDWGLDAYERKTIFGPAGKQPEGYPWS
jgi:hypothetical protein